MQPMKSHQFKLQKNLHQSLLMNRSHYVLLFIVISLGFYFMYYHLQQSEPLHVNTSKTLTLVAVADTHGKHRQLVIPNGDILIVAGDFSMFGQEKMINDFKEWLTMLPHTYKIVIPGNHEAHRIPKKKQSEWLHALNTTISDTSRRIIFLFDSKVEIMDGLTVYGSSWQCQWGGTGFHLKRNSKELIEKWKKIPSGTKILVTHAPPIGELADEDLYSEVVFRVKPLIHVYGHVHTGPHGIVERVGKTMFVHASICDNSYQVVHSPVVVEFNV